MIGKSILHNVKENMGCFSEEAFIKKSENQKLNAKLNFIMPFCFIFNLLRLL